MGPIIEAIEAGHYPRTLGAGGKPIPVANQKCEVCQEIWPCNKMRTAKKAQLAYAELLRRKEEAEKIARLARNRNGLGYQPGGNLILG